MDILGKSLLVLQVIFVILWVNSIERKIYQIDGYMQASWKDNHILHVWKPINWTSIGPNLLLKKPCKSTLKTWRTFLQNMICLNLHTWFSILMKLDSPQKTYSPKILTEKGKTPNAITSIKSTMVTCIGASNAIGNSVPPFLIFKGKRQNDIKQGATPGCGFALSEKGWSNSVLFQKYIQEHFLKYVQRPPDKYILILFDGSSTHMNIGLIEWAKQHIILFVQPPHSSHFLQPLDVGVSEKGPTHLPILHQSINTKQHCASVFKNWDRILVRTTETSFFSKTKL